MLSALFALFQLFAVTRPLKSSLEEARKLMRIFGNLVRISCEFVGNAKITG